MIESERAPEEPLESTAPEFRVLSTLSSFLTSFEGMFRGLGLH